MESGTEREAFAYELLCSPPDPNSRMAGEEDLSVKPRHGKSGREVMAGEPTKAEVGPIPLSPLTVRHGGSSPTVRYGGTSLTVRYGGTTLPLTDLPTGAVEDTSDLDRLGYEIRGGSKGSYPLEVVSSPPSDRER